MKNLLTRSITGIIFIVLILGSLFLGKYSYAVIFGAILAGGLFEFYSLFKNKNYSPNKTIGYLSGLSTFILVFLVNAEIIPREWLFCIFPFLLLFFITELYRKKETPLENIAINFFAFIFLVIPLSLINLLVFPAFDDFVLFSPNIFIAVLIIIWVYDSAAYLFGVTLGKHRLFERISPKKSWEGAIGGASTAVASSYLLSLFIPEIGLVHWPIFSSLIVVSATFGDLSESLLKRAVGVKDSGKLIPGHGGILDRFDSLLFAVPVAVLYLKLFIA